MSSETNHVITNIRVESVQPIEHKLAGHVSNGTIEIVDKHPMRSQNEGYITDITGVNITKKNCFTAKSWVPQAVVDLSYLLSHIFGFI